MANRRGGFNASSAAERIEAWQCEFERLSRRRISASARSDALRDAWTRMNDGELSDSAVPAALVETYLTLQYQMRVTAARRVDGYFRRARAASRAGKAARDRATRPTLERRHEPTFEEPWPGPAPADEAEGVRRPLLPPWERNPALLAALEAELELDLATEMAADALLELWTDVAPAPIPRPRKRCPADDYTPV